MNKLQPKTIILFVVIALVLSVTVGCDSTVGKLSAIGKKARITCMSGDTVLYSGESTGKVLSESHSDGYYFVDAETGHPNEISANCRIEYLTD